MNIEKKLKQYEGFKVNFMKKYFLKGAEREELSQFIDINIWKALELYEEERGNASESGWVYFYVEGRLKDEIKRRNRLKHKALNESLSMNNKMRNTYGNHKDNEYIDFIGEKKDMEKDTILKILFEDLLTRLSKMEKECLIKFMQGYSYEEIHENIKSVDNALQRVKGKAGQLKRCLKEVG